jgi:hypothetical protein
MAAGGDPIHKIHPIDCWARNSSARTRIAARIVNASGKRSRYGTIMENVSFKVSGVTCLSLLRFWCHTLNAGNSLRFEHDFRKVIDCVESSSPLRQTGLIVADNPGEHEPGSLDFDTVGQQELCRTET